MQIYPLSMNSVDWPTWNSARKAAKQLEATRGLDNQGIKIESPAALALSLDPNSLRHSLDNILGLVYLGFLLKSSDFPLLFQAIGVFLGKSYTQNDETIFVGNLVEWRFFVVAASNHEDVHIRVIGNAVFARLQKADLGDLWYRYARKMLDDGTFNLVWSA